jgi:cytochrome c peroxidase
MIACKPMHEQVTSIINIDYQENTPIGFPSIDYPSDNKPSKKRIELGKKLFFDPILSKDSSISCASCHNPEFAFSDAKKLSTGIKNQIGERNAPAIFNIAYHSSFFRDGGVISLENQALAPITNPKEMDMDLALLISKLEKNQEYIQLFDQAYQTKPSVYSLSRAIAAFERTILSGESVYDQYISLHDTNLLSSSAKRGLDIFNGKAQCNQCHGGFNFSNQKFENNGLYETYTDMGRFRITTNNQDIGKFKVPSLRNLSYTAPYMHDGSMATLEEVIEHYNIGTKKNRNQSKFVKPLALTNQEKEDLIQFLLSLNDSKFVKK